MTLMRYSYLYHLYKSLISKVIRSVFVIIISLLILSDIYNHLFPKFYIFLLSLFLMLEIIYCFKVSRVMPKVTIDKNNGDNSLESFTLQSLDIFLFTRNIADVIRKMLSQKYTHFLLSKANILSTEIPILEIGKDNLAKKALEVAKTTGGRFITRADIFIAYLLIIEQQSQLLFKKNIKTEELLYILYWTRIEFPQEENPPKKRVAFLGEGIVDNWTFGWTRETKKYITDITYNVLNEKPVLLGRKKEFTEIINILSKPVKNNVLLIGEIGVGKTSLVNALAFNSIIGKLSKNLNHKRVYQLMVGQLVAGVVNAGDLESRLQAILEELSHAGNIILFIPDLENISGSQTFHLDLSGALTSFLKAGKLPTIATITPGAYKQFIEPHQVFSDMFENIKVEEPERSEAIQMLLEKAEEIEGKNKVTLTYKAVIASIDLAIRFMQDRTLPGSAVNLLLSVVAVRAGTKATIDEKDVIAKIEEKTHVAIATPGKDELSLLLHLEDKLKERIIGQEEAINAISQAIRRLRSGMASQTRPISFLFLGPTGVGKTETAKALADIYFGGENKIIRLDMSEYTGFDALNRLLGATAGEGMEKGELTEKIYDHPFSLVLLDEFEKANQQVLDLFLQILEDGRLTDNKGKKVSFANAIIIATSNAGAFYIQEKLTQNQEIDDTFERGLMKELEKQHIFKPELINRFDDTVVFAPLTQSDTIAIAKLYFKKIQNDLQKQNIFVQFDNNLISIIAKEGYDPQFGARHLRRLIQSKIEDAIAKKMLENELVRGSNVLISFDDKENIVFSPIQKG